MKMKHYIQLIIECRDTEKPETTTVRLLVTDKEQGSGKHKPMMRRLALANGWKHWTWYFEKEVTI